MWENNTLRMVPKGERAINMNCSKCGNELTEDMFHNGICFSCGHPTSESERAFNKQQDKIKEEHRKAIAQQKEKDQKQYAEATQNHMLTTGYNFDGYTILKYHGLVSGECVLGSGLFSFLEASIANTLGTETSGYSEKMRNAKQLAVEDMVRQSIALGGNSIIGISYSISNLLSNMIGISVDGTSVTIEKNQIPTYQED